MEHYYVVNGNEYGVDLDTKKNFTNLEDAKNKITQRKKYQICKSKDTKVRAWHNKYKMMNLLGLKKSLYNMTNSLNNSKI